MPRQRSERGQLSDVVLPEKIAEPAIAKPAAELRGLNDELVEAGRERARLEDARLEAVDVDEQAYADALRARKADPGQKRTEKADAAIVAARRREEALGRAVDQALDALSDSVEKHRASYAERIEKDVASARAELAGALDTLQAARARLSISLATGQWLGSMPEQFWWRPERFATQVPGLRSENGSPLLVDAVVSALRDFTVDRPAVKGTDLTKPGPRATEEALKRSNELSERYREKFGHPPPTGISVAEIEDRLAGS